VNPGGEPERDDTGLPPVDIEIPDDARDLDRDVQAYFRELRAERRRLRRRRLHGKIARDGIVLPLMACCLIFALITGTLLTIFTATSDQNLVRVPGSGGTGSHPLTGGAVSSGAASRAVATSPIAASGSGSQPNRSGAYLEQMSAPLPAGSLTVMGSRNPIVPLRNLTGAILVLVQPRCGCSATIRWLAVIGMRHGVQTFLVGTQKTINEAESLKSRLNPSLQPHVVVALDGSSLLSTSFRPHGLTAVLVAAHPTVSHSVAIAYNLGPSDDAKPLVQALR
jgi:hypothetical protein